MYTLYCAAAIVYENIMCYYTKQKANFDLTETVS